MELRMRATEFIRNLLDIIDDLDGASEPTITAKVVAVANEPDDINHFKQIADLISSGETSMWQNEPEEKYSSIDAVTIDAGGGVNGPKNPRDLRGNSFPIFKKGI